MERIKKEDVILYDEKSNNVATIKGAFGILSYPLAVIMLGSFAVMFSFLNVYINSYITDGSGKHLGDTIACLVIFIVSIAVILIRLLTLRTPTMYFVGKDLYIKENKDFYLKVSSAELEGYSWITYSASGRASSTSRTYWGKINLIINGSNYTISSSSLIKTKHYMME